MDMRTPGDNPFTPGYGIIPAVFAGRQPRAPLPTAPRELFFVNLAD